MGEDEGRRETRRRGERAVGRCPEAAGQGGGQAPSARADGKWRLTKQAEKQKQCLCKRIKTSGEQRALRKAGRDAQRTPRSQGASRALVRARASPQPRCLQILPQVHALLNADLTSRAWFCFREMLLTAQNQRQGWTWHHTWVRSC